MRPRLFTQALLLILLAFVFFLLEPPEPTLKWNAVFDAGHFLLFAAAAWLLADVRDGLTPGCRPSRTPLFLLIVLTALAVSSEATQLFAPMRVASLGDVLRDVAGGVWALALRTVLRGSAVTGRYRRLLTAGVTALPLIAITPAAMAWDVYRSRDRAFPYLLTLDGSWQEQRRIALRGSTLGSVNCPAQSHPGTRCAALTFDATGYPGVLVDEPFPDWSAYQRLVFSVWRNESQPLTLGVDIFDRHYDGRDTMRFNHNVSVTEGHHQIVIPLTALKYHGSCRPLDLTAIRGVRVYAVSPRHPTKIIIGSIRLE